MNDVVRKLASLNRRGKLPHGILFIGSDPEITKNHLLDLAASLFCANEGCGDCLSCRKLRGGNHPDFLSVRAEGKEIKIEQVRDFQRWINLGPHEAETKIGAIEEADLLNASSSNALLKTLEEPPSHAVIILTVRSFGNILPTVRSRLMPVRFPSPSDDSRFETNRPGWGNDLEELLAQDQKVAPDQMFELTDRIAKDKENLPWFFWVTQKTLRDRMIEARERGAESRRLETIFDLSAAAERDVLRRYGNVALALDRFLSEWLL
ncbi:MAG: hypothetical protein V1495_07695 [Pseudomonadota bacterium]